MASSTLSKIGEFVGGVFNLLSGLSGIGFWLFAIGFILLLLIVLVIFGRLVYMVIKAIPNMTVNQFFKFIIVLAIVLIIAGLIMP